MKRTIFISVILVMVLAACGGLASSKSGPRSNQFGVVTIYTEPT